MMTIRSRRFSLALAAGIVGIVGVAACGSDQTVRPADEGSPAATADPVLRKIRATGTGAWTSAGRSSVGGGGAEATSAPSADMSMRIAWMRYVLEGELPDLGATGPAWAYEAGQALPIERATAIAAAFGITAEPVALPADYGGGWRFGPEDGTAPSITFSASPLLDWYYSPAWATEEATRSQCVDPAVTTTVVDPKAEPAADGASESSAGGEAPARDAAVSDEAGAPDGGTTTEPGTAGGVDVPACEIQPPANVPSRDEALARARDLFAAAGFDLSGYDLQADGDEWGAYVTAYQLLGGTRSPMSSSIGFGADGAVTWAGGILAAATPAGDYPLISPTEGIDRLNEQAASWYGGGEIAIDATGAAEAGVGGDAGEASPPDVDGGGSTGSVADEPATSLPAIEEPVMGEPFDVVITGVTLELTSVWDLDGTVWLLPAYSYTNADGVMAIIPAVTDEYLVQEEFVALDDAVGGGTAATVAAPVAGEPTPTAEPAADGAPGSEAPAPPDVIGLTEDEAAKVAGDAGWALRVVSRDGTSLPVTMDYRTNRLNATLEGGVVVEVTVG